MQFFQNLSIRRKLTAIVVVAASTALLLAFTAFVGYELNNYRSSALSELRIMAQMIAGTSTAAIAFGDSAAAAETLNTLRSEGRIVEAAIYRREGAPLARFTRDSSRRRVPAVAPPDGYRFEGAHLLLIHPVVLAGERLGAVYMKSDLTEMYARLRRYALIGAVVLLLSLLVALIVSSVLQHLISKPILRLAETAGQVSRDNNYQVRAAKLGEDEIGVLVDSFNRMLEQIHARDLALQAARDELEDRVEQRTSELQVEIAERKSIERDLIAAKDAAEASSRAKSIFLANMSHELRTPLNAIIGYSEMLVEDAEADGRAESIPDLQKITGAGKHLLTLINDVLDISKIEAGRMEVQSEPLIVSDLVRDATATVEPLARKNGNRFEVQCDSPGDVMNADPVKFRQSLFNLLSNACKFTENGAITLSVKRRTKAGEDWFDWEVSDTGIGIAPEQMHKLFQSFSQVDASTTRKHGGTGLGLAISRKLIELMGGTILAESRPGNGSRFTIRMPVSGASNRQPSRERHKTETPSPAPAIQTVLIIDDDPAVQDLLSRSLSRQGFIVETAFNGRDGLRKAKEIRPSAIVLDIMLPDLDGWTVFRQLRADPALEHAPVLVHTITENRGESRELGAAEFLQKPVPVEQLVGLLKKHSSGEAGMLTETLKAVHPGIFEADAAFSAFARIAEVSESRITLDLKMTGDNGRELFNQLAHTGDWQRITVMRGIPDGGAVAGLAGLTAALAAQERTG